MRSVRDVTLAVAPRPNRCDYYPVYRTCLFCNLDLGRNEVVETFPVGRRLAFDGERGRLWVVCESCHRWNLTPWDERWEAIETCERLFRSTPLRTSTDNVGLTRLREGLVLVRIGRPLRPEFAAWRYLPIFQKRRVAALAGAGARGLATTYKYGTVWVLPAILMAAPPAALLTFATDLRDLYRLHVKTYATLRDGLGVRHRVRGTHLSNARVLLSDDDAGWVLEVEHADGITTLRGASAERVLGRLLVAINREGGGAEDVGRAVDLLGGYDGAGAFLQREARAADWRRGRRHWFDDSLVGAIKNRAPSARLALEMALHEHVERQALEGELSSLQAAWRDAEEIAAIADAMGPP